MRHAWLLVLGLGSGLLASCFDAPSADVMFSCDPASAPACPDGYTCESDGCCHRDGSDFSAHAGECRTISTDGGSEGGTDPATSLLTTESSGGTSESGSTSDATTDTGVTESSTTDTTSTGDDASSSGAGSTDTGSSSTG